MIIRSHYRFNNGKCMQKRKAICLLAFFQPFFLSFLYVSSNFKSIGNLLDKITHEGLGHKLTNLERGGPQSGGGPVKLR